MKVVHYTKEKNFRLRKIEIENCPIFPKIKPKGGIWTSPVESKYGWDKCEYSNIDKLNKVEILIDIDDGNLIIIDKEEDLDKLVWTPIPEVRDMVKYISSKIPHGLEFIDFERMKESGIYAIYLTEHGQEETQLTLPRNLYTWDCETILILNERCIKSWRILDKEE